MLQNTPPITYGFLSITILFSAIASYTRTQSYNTLKISNPTLSFDEIIIPILQLVPAQVVKHPWTILISAFVETSPFQFISGLLILFFGINFLYSQWSVAIYSSDDEEESIESNETNLEILKFISIVIIMSNFFCLLFTIVFNVFFATDLNVLQLPLQYGLFILVIPISVVAKQLKPETNIKVFSIFKFRLRRLPFILLSLSLAISVVFISASPLLPAFNSFIISWLYLRYFQVIYKVRGDASDTFSLINFFPDKIKPVLNPLFDGIYQLSVLLSLIRPWNDDEIDNSNIISNHRSNPVRSTTISADDNERRKQIALNLIEQSV